jgi:hypothetical protein
MRQFLMTCVTIIFLAISSQSFALEMNRGTAVGAVVGGVGTAALTGSAPAALVGTAAGAVVGTAVDNKK